MATQAAYVLFCKKFSDSDISKKKNRRKFLYNLGKELVIPEIQSRRKSKSYNYLAKDVRNYIDYLFSDELPNCKQSKSQLARKTSDPTLQLVPAPNTSSLQTLPPLTSSPQLLPTTPSSLEFSSSSLQTLSPIISSPQLLPTASSLELISTSSLQTLPPIASYPQLLPTASSLELVITSSLQTFHSITSSPQLLLTPSSLSQIPITYVEPLNQQLFPNSSLELSIPLTQIPPATTSLEVTTISSVVLEPSTDSSKSLKRKCFFCNRSKDKKVKSNCTFCSKFVCTMHGKQITVCVNCVDKLSIY